MARKRRGGKQLAQALWGADDALRHSIEGEELSGIKPALHNVCEAVYGLRLYLQLDFPQSPPPSITAAIRELASALEALDVSTIKAITAKLDVLMRKWSASKGN